MQTTLKYCNSTFKFIHQLKKHIESVHRRNVKSLRIASLNIGRGLFKKEELLINTIIEQNCDICCISEVDIKDFDENKPFSIKDYKSFFPLQRPGTRTKRLICFVKEHIEVVQRTDLMSNLVSSVWLEIQGTGQKTLICATYREFSNLTVKGQMTIDQQLEGWKIFLSQVEQASKEGLILCLGDMNINLELLEDPTYYLKKLAEEYQLIIGECGLEILNFGITWNRICKDGVVKSAVDQAFTNKPYSIHNYFKTLIDYSDHDMICVDLNMKVSKSKFQSEVRGGPCNPSYW